jgi:hypothetical protein
MANCPVPSNPAFTRSGSSVFENITIWGKTCINGIDITGQVLFYEDATFNKDVTINGDVNVSFLVVKTRLDVGVGGTALNIDTRTEQIGIFTATPQQKFQFNSDEDSTVVITGLGTVGIGTIQPGVGISYLNDSTQGKLSLEVETIGIKRNIYDSVGYHGTNGGYLQRDEFGIRWTEVTPAFTEGIYVQDEGVYIPTVGAAQSFTALNFTQLNSLGVGTDTIVPIPNPSNPGFIADIQSQDLWGYNDSGNIYRMTNVGINQNSPAFTLDVDGTLNVTGATTLNSTLDVDDATTLNSTLDVDGATTLNNTLDVDGATTLNNTLDVDDATTLNSTLDVDGATTLNNTLDVDGLTTFNDVTEATSINSASVQIDGGVGIVKKLFVGGDTKLESTLELESSLIDINNLTGVAGKDYRLASVGTGVSWRPSGVETQNTIWVSKNGDDSNSGLLEGDAKATIGAAAAIAQEGDTIKIRPGRYIENNPIGLRTDVSVTGEDIRLVTIEPQNTSLDVFWVRRGCLIENLNFAGETVGVTHFGAGAVAFPKTGVTANSGYTASGPADEGSSGRWRSPYIRNCTNFMSGSIGMKIDGDDATASIPGADLKSMVCDSFTQYNENGIGVSITNNGYAQLVSIFTINCDIAIYVDTGGSCDLTNSNSSFGNYGLYAVGLGRTEYTGTVLNDVIPGDNSDVIVGTGVTDANGVEQRPFDGQALFFQISNVGQVNYPDAVAFNQLTEPLQQLERIDVIGSPSGYSAINPPSVIIRDADGTVNPKGPQGIVAEASATVDANGVITEIDVINSGRNYLPTQNIVVDIEGNTSLATAVMSPIYFTVSAATSNVSGITTITFNEFVPYELFSGDPFVLKRISRILTSSHSFEYVGTGTSINTALPFRGALPIKANEVVALDGAQVPFTSTDQKGNFDIGVGIQVDQTTSTVRGRDFSKAIQAEVTPLILALR